MTTTPALPGGVVSEPATVRGTARRYLMCPPDHFRVDYCINPWMTGEPVCPDLARRQWDALRDVLTGLGHNVSLMAPVARQPDLVFTANGGLVIGDRAMAPRFRHGERAGEEEHFRCALAALDVREVATPSFVNEGEGDVRRVDDVLLLGTGFRSEPGTAAELEEFFGLRVQPLRLVDPRFYHLDTALAVLDDHTIAYWPGAFDARSQDWLARFCPDAVTATEDDAAGFGLNLVSDGATVVLPVDCPSLTGQLRARGYDTVEVEMTEFRKAGGGPKCCVLEAHPAPGRPA